MMSSWDFQLESLGDELAQLADRRIVATGEEACVVDQD
jgi:hypothetical protein